MAFNQTEYITKWERENCDQIKIRVPKGNSKILKELSLSKGISMNQLIIAAIEEKYNIDLTTKTQ